MSRGEWKVSVLWFTLAAVIAVASGLVVAGLASVILLVWFVWKGEALG